MALLPRPVGPGGPVLLGPEARRVRLVLLSGVGDVVRGLPLACDLARAHPDVEVTWVAEPVPAQVLRHHPAIHRVVVYRKADGLGGLRALRRDLMEAARLDGGPPHLVLNVQRYLKSVWPTLFQRAPVRVGLPPAETRDGIGLAHTHVLEHAGRAHVQDVFLDFRWALGIERGRPPEWGITFSPDERSAQASFVEGLSGRRRVGLVLASANRKKDWPAGRFAELAPALTKDLGLDVLLLGGPGARDRAAAEAVLRACPSAVDGLGDGLRRLMWRIDACDVVVAPDTGPLHVAEALGVPVVGLFGHTNPARVGPYGCSREMVVDRYTDPGMEPDPSERRPKLGRMERIPVGDVLERVEAALTWRA